MCRMEWLTLLLVLLCGAQVFGENASTLHGNGDFSYTGRIARYQQAKVNKKESVMTRSIELAKKLSMAQNDEEFLALLDVEPPPQTYPLSFHERFGGTQRSNEIRLQNAKCLSELRVVPLIEDAEINVFYYPECVRVNRCSGCCQSEKLSCQPNSTETWNVAVTKIHGKRSTKIIVPLEVHTSCKCHCKVQEKDCNEKQYYVENECRCICKNTEAQEKCEEQYETKYWDYNKCTCECKRIEQCVQDYYFDPNTCSCKRAYVNWWQTNENRRTNYNNYNRQPVRPSTESQPVIVPLGANNPQRRPMEDPEYK